MLEILSYTFMQRAFVTGIFVAIACALLGTFLVLRRYALIGDGLAHISFGGVAFGLLVGITPFFGALVFAIFGALGIIKLKEGLTGRGDSAIGIISHASLGLGILIVSAARGFNVEMLSYLFGSILAIKSSEVAISIALAGAVISAIIVFYNDLFHMTFSEESARVSGTDVGKLNSLLMILTAVTVVVSMKVVGLLLASALIILPASSALQFKTSFRKTLLLASAISAGSVIVGLTVAYYYDLAPSGTIVIANALLFTCLLLARRAGILNKG